MSNPEAVARYVQLAAAFARTLPVADAVVFLTGAVEAGQGNAAVETLRGTLRDLSSADDQLELIAGPQLRLKLA